MNQSEQLEIDRLLSQIADEGTSPELVRQLSELLLDRPDLQEHYSQVMRLHMLLMHEMGLSSPSFKPVVPRPECQFVKELNEDCSIDEELMASLGRDPLLSREAARRQTWSLSFLAASAAVLLFV